MGRPEELDPREAIGLVGMAAWEIVYEEDDVAALQIPLVDQTSLVFTVWTDWTLIIERRADIQIPDYCWPPEKFSQRNILADMPASGLKITSLELDFNEKGEPVRADISIGPHRISARMFGGDLQVSVD